MSLAPGLWEQRRTEPLDALHGVADALHSVPRLWAFLLLFANQRMALPSPMFQDLKGLGGEVGQRNRRGTLAKGKRGGGVLCTHAGPGPRLTDGKGTEAPRGPGAS